MSEAILELRGVGKDFAVSLSSPSVTAWMTGRRAWVRAVDQVSLSLYRGETLGLVGESGSGKSTLARLAAGLSELSRGERFWQGHVSHAPLSRQERLAVQMIFQDPYGSLNPRMRVGALIGEAPLYHGLVESVILDTYVSSMMEMVGLDARLKSAFAHELSGGQRARVGIARALAVKPEVLICDEAVAALDVSVQAQVLNLLNALQSKLGLTILFVSHDLSVVRHMADRVQVMYLGRIVESVPAGNLFDHPIHPYSKTLLAHAPGLDLHAAKIIPVRGEIPTPLDPPQGCHFHPRCPIAIERCGQEIPALREISPKCWAACHLA